MKTYTLKINEDELRALINHHKYKGDDYSNETGERIHQLTKKLNKEGPELSNDPRPSEQPEAVAAGWGDPS